MFSHKFNHNFLDTVDPMCLRNDGIDNTEHLLQKCHESQRHLLGEIKGQFPLEHFHSHECCAWKLTKVQFPYDSARSSLTIFLLRMPEY